jgi:GntR family transcriptional repressor for pyruvate dehydrogenase complex
MEYQPDLINVESVISKAAYELRRLIARTLRPGDCLPPEMQLSTMLGISRKSVREALRLLDGLGFIDKSSGKRAVVRSHTGIPSKSLTGHADILEAMSVAYDARMLIEQRCAELAARRASSADLAALGNQLSRFEESLRHFDYPAAVKMHGEFHAALVRAASNPILASMFEAVRFVIAELGNVAPEVFKDHRLPALHRAIYRAVVERDPVRPAMAVRRHFRANRPRIEFKIRTSHETAGLPARLPSKFADERRGFGWISVPDRHTVGSASRRIHASRTTLDREVICRLTGRSSVG